MVSKAINDYEVLSILGSDINSCYYKVKDRRSSETYVWKAIALDTYSEEDLEMLLKEIDEIINRATDENLLKIYDYILYDRKVLYLIVEYCSNGSLYEIIEKCRANEECIEDNFIKLVLYELAGAVKRHKLDTRINIRNVFVDKNHSVKLMIFKEKRTKDSVSDICGVMQQMLLLQADKDVSSNVPNYYSQELKNMAHDFIRKRSQWTLGTILCHPLFLVKPDLKNITKKIVCHESETKLASENDDNHTCESKLSQALYRKENHLKKLEEKLKQRENEIEKREKKVSLMERLAREKVRRAEVYLMNAQNCRKKNVQKSTYEKFDTSFSADCGDSCIISTTAKLFSPSKSSPIKSGSERRIKFKGHSPLKEINYNYYKRASSNSDVARVKSNVKSYGFPKLFMRDKSNDTGPHLRPLSWNEETKRQAFQLLKTINHNKDDNIKHTFM